MAVYETGTSTGPADLIATKLATFAIAQGWTVQNIQGGLFRQFLKGSVRVNLAWNVATIYGQMSDGYNSASNWNAQPSAATDYADGNIPAGPYTAYHFFSGTEAGAEYLHVCVEWSAGNFWHMMLGTLVKFGSYTGGQYYDNLYVEPSYKQLPYSQGIHRAPFDTFGSSQPTNSGQIRADIDGKTTNWLRQAYYWTGNAYTGGMRGGLYANLVYPIGYQKYNSLTPLHPVVIWGDRPSGLRSLLGRVPDLRQVSMRNLTPGQLLTIGADQWQCFPLWTRSDSVGVFLPSHAGQPQYSHYFGIAYKR
jgi:hypothetical protein